MPPTRPNELARRRFTEADQLWFAKVSGDQNPLHVDPLVARRLLAGEQVVHGMHVLLWMLDGFLSAESVSVAEIRATFPKPVLLGEELVLTSSVVGSCVLLRVERHGTALVEARVTLCDASPVPAVARSGRNTSVQGRPKALSIDEMEGLSGTQAVTAGAGPLLAAFPVAADRLGPPVVEELAAVSTVVGMQCPGMHSILAAVSVTIGTSDDGDGLSWRVVRTDGRVGGVRLEVTGTGLQGQVQAFLRPEPVSQVAARALAGRVDPREFHGVRALVVGGSRGLGELSAKLLAAGGAEVVVTWHRGRAEAEGVVEDIQSVGGDAMAWHLDSDAPEAQVSGLIENGHEPTHVLYFASPRISPRRTRNFDDVLMESFIRSYVTGFVRTAEACLTGGSRHLVAFYPSSVFVAGGQRDLVEYAAAKAAGEVAARSLSSTYPDLDVIIERLPRLPSDQTASLLEAEAADPIEVLLPIVRRVASV